MPDNNALFSFVDLKDPFAASEIEGEGRPGPVLSILGSRHFQQLHLFHTPHAGEVAQLTQAEVNLRFPHCRTWLHRLPVSDPKDYSAVMGSLAHAVRNAATQARGYSVFVCVSSGTAEMRTAWFILASTGLLPATMLQVGSPAEPLFGAANVKEVPEYTADWQQLRDLVMPQTFFSCKADLQEIDDLAGLDHAHSALECRREEIYRRDVDRRSTRADRHVAREIEEPPESELNHALKELNLFVGSAVMRDAAERASVAASDSDLPVLVTGETGTGKEMFARLIHRLSARREREMIAVNCAAIPKDLVESHLFGHVKGAFTGASADHAGKFESAHGSTLFLDEIGELTLEAQAKILRVLEDSRIERVGSSQPKKVDVRIVAATNRNLIAEVSEGRFRQDLYYRLAVVEVRLPPLRQRTGELPLLANALMKQINQKRQNPRQLTPAAVQRLVEYTWPGNARELRNVLQSAALFSKSGSIGPSDLEFPIAINSGDPLGLLPDPYRGFELTQFLEQVKRRMVLRALEMSGGNQTRAAELLGMSKQNVSKILKGGDDHDS